MIDSSSRRSLARHAAGLLAMALPLWAMAGDEPRPDQNAWTNNLVLQGHLPGATRLEVTSPDVKGKPVIVTIAADRLNAGIHVPEGQDRRLVLSASNADGKVLYEGEVRIDVNAEFIPQVAVEFKSAMDGEAASLTLASHRVELEFAGVERDGELYTRINGSVFDADGRRIAAEGQLDWDIGDPWVRDHLLPCPESRGGTSLCAEFLPRKPGEPLLVDACFRHGICVLEYIPPVVPVWREVAVSMGGHGCALKLDGALYCWGQGEHGQLGYVAPKDCNSSGGAGATWGCSGFAGLVACKQGPCNFTQVSTGLRHTCAVDTNQDAWCWGDNYDGQLGLDDFEPTHQGSPEPRMVVGGFKFLAIRAAFNVTCGLTTTHQVLCWGDNNVGLIPTLSDNWANDPRLVSTPEPIVDLDVTYNHVCGRAVNGNLYCWGSNQGFELGTLSWSKSATCATCPAMPLLMQANIPALANQQVSLLTTGAHGTCAHTTSGETPCWGWMLPAYPASRSLDRLSRGFQHYCAISRGTMQCAGMQALGDGSDFFEAPGVGPVTVDAKTYRFRELDTGRHVTCAIGYDENVYCWGSTSYGQLGLGKPDGYVTQPTALVFPTKLRLPPPHRPWL